MADVYLPRVENIGMQNAKDLLWLKLTPRNNKGFSVTERGGTYNESGPKGDTYYFLFPLEFSHNIQHQWDEFDTIVGKARDAGSKVSKQYRTFMGTIGGDGKDGTGSKNDNPVMYLNSSRREYQFRFEFAVFRDSYNDVFKHVDKLVEHSLPKISGNSGDTFGVDFEEPDIFSAQTVVGNQMSSDMVRMRSCAIVNIAPTYIGPYVNGYPSKCILDLTLKDLDPLYQGTYRGGDGIVRESGISNGGG